MKKFLLMALLLVSMQAGAIDISKDPIHDSERRIDFANQSRKDEDGVKDNSLVLGIETRKGWRFEGSMGVRNTDLQARVSATIEAPILRADKFTIRVLGGIQGDPFAIENHRYRLGAELEWYLKKDKSFIFQLSNTYDPRTQTLASKPTITTGARIYF